MAETDFIYSVGVDTKRADQDLNSYVSRTIKTLETIPSFKITVDSVNAASSVNAFVRNAKAVTGTPLTTVLKADNTQALKSVSEVKAALTGLKGSASGAFQGLTSGATSSSGSMRGLTGEIQSQTKAIDFMGKAWTYSLLKFAEYEIIAKSIETAIHGLTASLKDASDVQFEMSLQKLYNPEVFKSIEAQNKAYQDASIIARQWGADVRDVLQVQGLWVKQTNDLTGARYLANQAEMMHRASGVETLEVYRSSIAMATQLGVKLNELPKIYDQISEAALKIAVPLNNFGGAGKQEAMKDLFQGSAESAATLASMGFTDKNDKAAGTIAIVANQIQATGENAKSAAKNLTSMFAALEGRGKGRNVFESIIGKPEDIHGFDDLMERMKSHVKELFQAYANGDLGVKPQQYETLASFEASLGHIKLLYDDIQKNSKGKLQLIADNQMELLKGQTDRLSASMKILGTSIGQELLPDALHFVSFLNGSLIPGLDSSAGSVVNVGRALAALGGAILLQQGLLKLGEGIDSVRRAQETFNLTTSVAKSQYAQLVAQGGTLVQMNGAMEVSELKSTKALQDAIVQMNYEKQALAELATQAELTAWKMGGLQAACDKAGVSVTDLGVVAGGSALNGLRAFAGGIATMAGAAVSAAAPILALLGVMQSLDAFDKEKNAAIGLKLALKTQNQGIGSALPEAALHSPQIALATVLGKEGELNQGQKDVRDIVRYGKGPEADDLRVQMDTLKRAKRKLLELGPEPEVTSPKSDSLEDYSTARDNIAQYKPIYESKKAALVKAQDTAIDQAAKDWATYKAHHNLNIPVYDAMKPNVAPPSTNKSIAQGIGEGPAYNKAETDRTKSSPEDILRHDVETHKRDSRADMTVGQDLFEAGRLDIETTKKQAETYGWTADKVKALTEAYHTQEDAIRRKIAAANSEVGLLSGDIKKADHQVRGTKEGTKAHEEAKQTYSQAVDAWKVTTAAARSYKEQLLEIQAAEAKDRQEAVVSSYIRAAHWNVNGQGVSTLSDLRGVGANAVRSADDAKRTGGASAQSVSAQASISQISAILPAAQAILSSNPSDALRKGVQDLIESLSHLKGIVTEDQNELSKLGQSAEGIGLSSMAKNGQDAAEALGLNKQRIQVVKDILEQVKQITEEHQRLLDLKTQIGTADTDASRAALANVDWAQKQLDIQAQMIPLVEQRKVLEEQIAAVRSSAAYKGFDSALDKSANSFLDTSLTNVFERSSRPTFAANKLGRPTKSGGVISGFMEDFMKTTGGDSLKGLTGNLTDKVFGLNVNKNQSEADKLKDIYVKAVDGQTKAAQTMLDASVNIQNAMSPKTSSEGTTGTSTASVGLSVVNGLAKVIPNKTASENAALALFLKPIAENTKAAADNTDSTGNTTGIGAIMTTLTTGQGKKGGTGASSSVNGGSKTGGFFGSHAGQGFSDKGGGSLGSVMAGMGEGEMASSLFGTSGPWGQILGGVGGAFGPVGGALGGILGGLIGPHWGPATNTPDTSNPAYGQWLANMNGTEAGVNGTQVDPNSQFNTYLGYGSESTQLANMVNSNSQVSRMTPQLQQFATDLKNLENSQGGGLDITNEHNGIATLGSGKSIDVTDYMNWTNQLEAYQNNNVPLAPLISMNAYGSSGAGQNLYNMPGLNASEAAAMQATNFGSKLNPSQAPVSYGQTQYQATPYSTTGLGTQVPSGTASQPIYVTNTGQSQPIQVTVPLMLNGNVLATAVASVNTQTAGAQGNIAA